MIVTGGYGFIGSHFIRLALEEFWAERVVNIDTLTYAGNVNNLRDLVPPQQEGRLAHERIDVADVSSVDNAFARLRRQGPIDTLVHFAAESHVDNSIRDPSSFVQTNVLGTGSVLLAALRHGVRRIVHVSTDEVYGSLTEDEEPFKETAMLRPTTPYSASKAASDLLALSYFRTYRLPVIITRSSNNYGPNQHVEKFIPRSIKRALNGLLIQLHGDGTHIRDWIHVRDNCRGIFAALTRGRAGEVYNLGTGYGVRSIEIAEMLLQELGQPESNIEYVEDRSANDLRYALNVAKATTHLSWRANQHWHSGLRETVRWYKENPEWLE